MTPLAEVGHVGMRGATELLTLRPAFTMGMFGSMKAAVGAIWPFARGAEPGTSFFITRRGAVDLTTG